MLSWHFLHFEVVSQLHLQYEGEQENITFDKTNNIFLLYVRHTEHVGLLFGEKQNKQTKKRDRNISSDTNQQYNSITGQYFSFYILESEPVWLHCLFVHLANNCPSLYNKFWTNWLISVKFSSEVTVLKVKFLQILLKETAR